MHSLSVVIPAYNEEKGIADIMHRVLSIAPDLSHKNLTLLELLIVDDGSRDCTAQVASEFTAEYPCVRVIRHPKNRGYGAALKTGFAEAQGDMLGFLDADGTYPPEHFPALCEAILQGNDLVIGSRMAGAESKMPLTRRIGNLFFANLLSAVSLQRVTDSASGMRVFRRTLLERLYPLPDGLNLTPVMSTRALHEGVKLVEVAIPYSERVGRSKLSVVRDGKIFLESILWTAMMYNPVRILGMLGLAGMVFALLALAGLVLVRLSGVTSLGPWGVSTLFAALVSGVAGISVFALGMAFNYLVSLFYNRPIRQGLFGRPIFNTPLEHYFGVLGLIAALSGIVVAAVSLGLGVQGWDITRLWLYLLGSAMMILVGIQLIIFWILLRVLGELSHREALVKKDMMSSKIG